MKRSTVNQILREGDAFIRSFGFRLPPFAYWSAEEFKAKGKDAAKIIDAGLGWDITDYGAGNFEEMGLFLFTVRNGSQAELQMGQGMVYAEKIMISRKDQISPSHRHILKTEDIINRGGATLAIEMYESDQNGERSDDAEVVVYTDGLYRAFKAGDVLTLEPGESVTLRPGNWHKFWGEGGDVLIGEVSGVNDDNTDNIFHLPIGRFPKIEEDEAPLHLLVKDYDAL